MRRNSAGGSGEYYDNRNEITWNIMNYLKNIREQKKSARLSVPQIN
jgi:hypothetical protein